MKLTPTRAAVAALLIGTSVAIGGGFAASQTVTPPAESTQEALVRNLESRSAGTVTVDRDPATGAVTFVGTEAGTPLAGAAEAGAGAEESAGAFVSEFATLFGAASPAELERVQTVPTPESGGASVEYQQTVGDVPVMAGELRVQVDGAGDIRSALGELQPGAAAVDTTPTITADAAATEAVDTVAKAYAAEAGAFTASTPELWVYAPDLLGGDVFGPPRLVWRLEVNAGAIDELVLVDAHTGTVPLHFNQVAEAKQRRVCNQANVEQNPPVACTSPVRVEGQDPVGDTEVNGAYALTGAAYDFFKTRVSRDSIDGHGLPLTSIVRHCNSTYNCPMPNAFWLDDTMYFGAGWATADDVATHELTHGIVEYTAGLFYYFQSGAINEHIADVMGELMDQGFNTSADTEATRWLIGEDSPTGPLRSMANPPAYNNPDSMASPLYKIDTNDDSGGVHANSGVGNKAAWLIANGGSFNSRTVRGLGIVKTTRIYYQALTTMLGSGSDYADLARALPQGCTNAIGVDGITAGDCDQVALAVSAVAMSQEAPNSLSGPVPGCPNGTAASPVYSDDMEGDAEARWDFYSDSPGLGWGVAGTPPLASYATSGVQSLYTPDYKETVMDAVRTQTAIHLPATNPSVLTFNHAFGLESGFDYGVVEISADGGNTWEDLGPHMTHGAYNRGVDAALRFNGWSGGYASTRIDLGSYAGQNVLFQFRMVADRNGGAEGWWVDDFVIRSCGPANARPDAMIKIGTEPYLGNGAYNTNGSSQTTIRSVTAGTTLTYVIKVQNDGNNTEPFTLSGPGSNDRFQLTYLAGTTDITSQVVAGTYQTPAVAPGANTKIKLTIKVKAGAPAGANIAARVKATSTIDTTKKDVVVAQETVRR